MMRAPFSSLRIAQVVKKVLRALKKEHMQVGVALISDTRMRRLNREHRGNDSTTDVLSFPLDLGMSFPSGSQKGRLDAGDIFLSVAQIRRQAKALGIPEKEEFLRMLIHGILHVFGYDHLTKRQAQTMFRLQESLRKKIEREL